MCQFSIPFHTPHRDREPLGYGYELKGGKKVSLFITDLELKVMKLQGHLYKEILMLTFLWSFQKLVVYCSKSCFDKVISHWQTTQNMW